MMQKIKMNLMLVKRTTTGIVALVVIVTAGGGYWFFNTSNEIIRLAGTVEIQEVGLSSKVGGRIAKVAVTEGELVKPGQELIYLEVPELETQREQMLARIKAGPRRFWRRLRTDCARGELRDSRRACCRGPVGSAKSRQPGGRNCSSSRRAGNVPTGAQAC